MEHPLLGRRFDSDRRVAGNRRTVAVSGESELIAQELSSLGHKLNEFDKRLTEVERVNARLEEAALTTARALAEVSGHWDAVYEAMRRKDTSQEA